MYTLWRTEHEINSTIMDALHKGSIQISSTDEGFHYKHVHSYSGKPTPSVSYGILRGTDKIFKDCLKNKVEWWEIDRGYINPGHFDGYYRMTMNALRAPYKSLELPNDRLSRLNVKLENWQKGTHVLYAPPTPAIREFYGISSNFDNLIIRRIEQATDRPIKIRNKNLHRSLEEDLKDCHCVVTFNSNLAVDALIRGVPALTFTSELPNQRTIEHIEGDLRFDREKWLRYLSYCQFTLDEFRSGEAWITAQDTQKYETI